MRIKVQSFTRKRAFGIELEMLTSGVTQTQLRNVITKADSKHPVHVTGWQQSQGNSYWHVKTDSTCGYEVASYKAKGAKDVMNIAKIAGAIQSLGAKVDNSCGLHIHVETTDFNVNEMASLIANWIKMENIICEAVPVHRANNIYCKTYSTAIPLKNLENPVSFWTHICPTSFSHEARRKSLNVCNYAFNPGKRTVEFRMPEGTLDFHEIKNWTRLLVNFVHFIKKVPFPGNVQSANLQQVLQLLGLTCDEPFLILSAGLHETKEWFLHRILRYARSQSLCFEAVAALNKMWEPLKRYEINENCEEYAELT